jgi:hypothetical protein
MFDYKQFLLLGVKRLRVDTSIFGWPNNCKVKPEAAGFIGIGA